MSSKPPQMRRGGGQIQQQQQKQEQEQKRRLQLVESPEDEEITEAYRTEEEKEKEDEEDVEDVEFDQEDDVEDKEKEKSGEEDKDEQDQDEQDQDDDENRNEGRGDEMNAHEKGLPKRDQESERMELLAKRLRPRPMMLRTYRVGDREDPRQTPSWALVPHQVLHLHHMKTGGTSTDALLRCGLERMERLHQQEKQQQEQQQQQQQQEEQAKEHEEGSTPTSHARSSRATERIPYNSIHECGYSRYVQCVTGKDPRCINRANSSSVMSFCAPLSDLALFGWVDTSLSPPSSTTTSTSLSIIDAHDHHDHDHENEGEEKYENQDDGHTGGEVNEKEQDEKGGEGGGGKDAGLEGKDDDDHDEEDGETSMDEEPHYIDKITVMRHPVDRVWSMFRYTVRSCYQCRPLVDIYDDIDRRNDTSLSFICRAQLLNHQLANLMTTPNVAPQNLTDRHLEEAITNLYESITLLGMTSDMDATAEMLGRVWPWLAERLPPAAAETTEIETTTDTEGDGHQQVGGKTEKGKEDNHGNKSDDARSKVCAMTHANASPRNNGCGQKHGSNSSHWDLPSEPDEATRSAILRHNMLDMKLYEAGLERFELQRIILGMTTTADLLEGEGRDANRDEVQNEEDKEGQ